MPDADIYFIVNQGKTDLNERFAFAVKNSVPELWHADQGVIQRVHDWKEEGDSTYVQLVLHPDESVFVVFPKNVKNSSSKMTLPAVDVLKESNRIVNGSWKVKFEPKLDKKFERNFTKLVDFSTHSDASIKYFSGTATYIKEIKVEKTSLAENKRVMLDLGEMNDIAEVKINGKNVGVLWYPPYRTDITPWLKAGTNKLEILVTNNWANRLIGDEQYPADFEWGQDRGLQMGRAMKAFPDWFIQKKNRPSKERKAFCIWSYYRKDSPLQPAGLVGPVQLIEQTVKVYE